MIERAFPKINSQKHRLNILDILGSCSNTKFLFFSDIMIERAVPKRNSQKRRLNILDMLGSFENKKFLFLPICTLPIKSRPFCTSFAYAVPALLPALLGNSRKRSSVLSICANVEANERQNTKV